MDLEHTRQSLRESREEVLHARSRARVEALASNVAHEINNLNNPLVLNTPVIEQIVDAARPLLDERCRDEGDFRVAGIPWSKLRERISTIIEGTREATRDIQEYAARLRGMVSGEAGAHREAVDLREVVETAAGLTKEVIEQSTDRFSLRTPNDALPTVAADPKSLCVVVMELIENACYALSCCDQAIAVAAHHNTDQKTLTVTVADEGCGMDSRELDRIFEPFYTTGGDSDGIGLGLCVAQRIVEKHSGCLEFDSEPGRGTTACVILPAEGNNEED